MNFESRDALRTVAWLKFQDEMEEYIECYGTSLVPHSYVNPVSGYMLGQRLDGVRQGKLWRGHPDQLERIEWLESLPNWAWNAMETDEWREAVSERAKKQFESQEARDAMSERAKKQFESKEARNASSNRAKAQAAREAAEGKPSLVERGKATRIENWTKEQREAAKIKRASTVANRTQSQCDAISAKKTATAAAKRAAVLAALPESERPKKQAGFDRNDLKEANRRGKANALLQLPSYAEKGYQCCYRNLTQATKDGVVFFQDPGGVWCARMGNQGASQGAGSSSEHAKLTVGGSAAAAIQEAAPAASAAQEQQEVPEEATVAGA